MRMTRRGFLAFLGTTTVSAREVLGGPVDVAPGMVVLECFVAGLRFHAGGGIRCAGASGGRAGADC